MTDASGTVSIAFLLERPRPFEGGAHVSHITEEVLKCLRDKGADAGLIVPENSSWDLSSLRLKHDLYVLKSETPLALSLAGALTLTGAEIVNTFSSVTLARDKIAATAVLAASGIRVPPSFATGSASLLLPLLKEGPLWIKPRHGTKGAGVRRVTHPEELGDVREKADPYGLPLPFFVQKEVPSDGKDLKVYVVGDNAWAVERSFPAETEQDKEGRRVTLPECIQDAAFACGRALGLELYGVDFLVSGEHFTVVDVNAYPGYKGVKEAPEILAEYIYRRALAAQRGKGAVR